MQRLASLLTLIATLIIPALHVSPRDLSARKTMPSSMAQLATCEWNNQGTPTATIVTPQSNSTISGTVSLQIAPGQDAMTEVDVCANYYDPGGVVQQVATLTAGGSWRGTWDASQIPAQPGLNDISLSFIEEPSGVLIGTVSGLFLGVLSDTTPPSSTAAILATQLYSIGTSVYISATTPISISAADVPLPSGLPDSIAGIYYHIDGGETITYTAPFSLGLIGDGPHTITYWAVDGSGNAEMPHVLAVTLDTTPPVVNPNLNGNFDILGVASGPVTVTLNGQDPGSGVHQTFYSIDDGAVQIYSQPIVVSTSSLITYYAVDNVGNISAPDTQPISIAVPAPTPTPYPASAVNPPPTRTPRPANTPRPTETPRPTMTPRPTSTPRPPTATPTPRPTPTWAPIDGPPILTRQAFLVPAPSQGAATPLHLHMFPAPVAPRRSSHRTPARRHTASARQAASHSRSAARRVVHRHTHAPRARAGPWAVTTR